MPVPQEDARECGTHQRARNDAAQELAWTVALSAEQSGDLVHRSQASHRGAIGRAARGAQPAHCPGSPDCDPRVARIATIPMPTQAITEAGMSG